MLPLLVSGINLTKNPMLNLSKVKNTPERNWRMTEVLEERYELSSWVPDGKYTYYYSQDHPARLDSVRYEVWEAPDWITVSMQYITHDVTNEYVTHIEQTLNIMGELTPFARGDFTYDTQSRLTHAVYQFLTPSMEWVVAFRFQIDYISNTNYTVHNYQLEEEGTLPMWYRQNFTWDAQGRIIQEVQTASTDSLNWYNKSRNNLTYHPNDTTTGDIFVHNIAHYVPLQDLYDKLSIESFFGMLSEEMTEEWIDGSWVVSDRTLFTYNASDKLIERTDQYWNSMSWVNGWLYTFSYDINNNLHQKHENHWNAGNWDNDIRLTCTWEQTTANDDDTIPAVSTLSLITSPNPFRDNLSIELGRKANTPVQITIYNSKGQLIRALETLPGSRFWWDGRDSKNNPVPSGVYLLMAVTPEGSVASKVLKLK